MVDVTSGMMNVHVVFTAFASDNQKSSNVVDRAAPVMTQVEYRIGQIDVSGFSIDTVVFFLSEGAIITETERIPLLFKNDGGNYSLGMEYLKKIGENGFMYLVRDAGESAPVPLRNDSVWINTAPAVVSDVSNNKQVNPSNKRVALTLTFPPLIPELKWGPNPFNPLYGSNERMFRVAVKPKRNIEYENASISIKAALKIYDKVGTLVKKFDWITSDNMLELIWDGSNENGRIVGDGTYYGIFEFLFIKDGIEEVQPTERILIGVNKK